MVEDNAAGRIVLTPDGKRKLEEELNELKTVKRVEVAHEIEVARSFGDLSENAEYDEAKNEQARIEGRVRTIEDILRAAVIADDSALDNGVAGVGSIVRVFDMEYEEEDTYTIVGSTEADPARLMISTESSIGRALMGRAVGEVAEAQTPGGVLKMRILNIDRKRD